MALNFKHFWEGIKIKAKSVLTSDTKGELEVDQASGKLNYHDGAVRSPVVTEKSTATLTNKTFDANGTGNSITNIETADLASGVLNTSTSLSGASNTQIPSALAVKSYVDSGLSLQNEASEISYSNSVSGLAATNVQAAIDEVEGRLDTAQTNISTNATNLSNHISSTTAHSAANITNSPSGNLSATTVQAALNELQSDVDTRATTSSVSAHISSTTAHTAANLVNVPSGNLSATTVQAALNELQSDIDSVGTSSSGVQTNLDNHISSTTAHSANHITNTPSGNLAATDVQAALNELQSDVDTRATSSALSTHAGLTTGTHGVTGTIVGTSDSQTLTNKTIDADLNTITNIENADIKAGANIARSKLAPGTTNKLVANDGVTGALSDISDISIGTNALVLANTRHLEIQAADDATTTGSNATLASVAAGAVRLTNASLVSIANIPAGQNGQQVAIFNRTGVSVKIKDQSGALGSASARIFTGSGADIDLAANAALFFQYDSTSSRWQIIGGSGGSGAATSAVDNVFTINDATDATKQIAFDANGTTGTKTTIASSPTASRTITLPDATDTLVGKATSDVLTNKTIVAANNTITTAASGNLTSTELNAALAELQSDVDTKGINPDVLAVQVFDLAALSDFTQTGLSLSTTNPIKGVKSALLTHQAASTQSFKQVIAVDRKFRGRAVTASLSIRSSASSSNVTILVTDETNAATLLSSSQITTGQITSAVFNTNSNTTVNVTDNSILNQIKVGATITGSGIPANTVVTAVNSTARTVTISNAATATATGVSLKVSNLPTTQNFSFTIPQNCASISYTITALQEAGSPESYIDDVQIYLSQSANSSYSLTQTTFNATDWTSFTPTVTASTPPTVGSGATLSGRWRRVGSNAEVEIHIVCGTGATAGSGNYYFQLPSGLTIDTSKIASTGIAAGIPTPLGRALKADSGGAANAEYIVVTDSPTGVLLIDSAANVVSSSGAPFTSGRRYSLTASVPVVGWSDSTTTTTTIPLTSSVLVTQPDSYLRIVGFTPTNASTATKIISLVGGTIADNKGSAIQYLDDSVNGARFVAREEGEYTFTYSSDLNGSTACGIGFSLNSTELTTDLHGVTTLSSKLNMCLDSAASSISSVATTVYLKVGDIVRPHQSGGTISSPGSAYSVLTVTKNGSSQILNPSSDQKVVIPTHFLKFAGSAANGSTDTGVVLFTAMTEITGSGLTFTNNPTEGTVVTVNKDGILSAFASADTAGTSRLYITKNLTTKTTGSTPPSSELMGLNYGDVTGVSATFPVKVGDKIRIYAPSGSVITDGGSIFTLSLQEQSVSVALQNVTPTYSASDSAVRVTVGNGFGSTNTSVRRFSNLIDNVGTAVTYTDSASLGGSFTINEDGLYDISYTETSSGVGTYTASATLNSTTTNNLFIFRGNGTAADQSTGSIQKYLLKGDVIRAIVALASTVSLTSVDVQFSISKVGKTSGTVDVTPFVQIPQQDVEAIAMTAGSSTWGSTNTGVPVLNITTNTNKGIVQVLGDSTTGNYFKVLKDCEIKASVSMTSNAGGADFYITKNATTLTASAINDSTMVSVSSAIANAYNNTISATIQAVAGDLIRFQRSGTSITSTQRFTLTATAISSAVATSTQQVSSDTIPFVFKSTAIDPNTDAIGTFNTYTYAINSNTATIATTAPTQTTSSMNINGIQVFARAYNAASTAAQPARVDIFIGKGLKSKQVDGYSSTGKGNAIVLDRYSPNTTIEVGSAYSYNESTGILSIDIGSNFLPTITSKYAGLDTPGNGYFNAYFVFNASKSPSLVTVPNLVQRVAYLSDVKTSGTAGGSSVAGQQTRVLNTLVDPYGIVTSLSSNQFTLLPGTYQIKATAPAWAPSTHKIKLRNITDTTDPLIGTPENNVTTGAAVTWSTLEGEITITSTKTFSILHHTTSAQGTNGLGVATGDGTVETYTRVIITKIR